LIRPVEITRRRLLSAAAAAAAVKMSPTLRAGDEPRLPALPPPLPKEAFRRRQEKLRDSARLEGLDAVFVTPGTNLRYAANLTIERSERLTAFILLASGPCVVVTPYFERPRSEARGVFDDLQTWQESEDPIALCARIVGRGKKIGVEGTTAFRTAKRLGAACGGELADFTAAFDVQRSVKSAEEQGFIRAAADRTVAAIRATWKRLREGMTEEAAEKILEEEFLRVGTPSGGLVQFGPSSALPHGGPGGRKLARGDVVLIDTGCTVQGYDSDVTRMACFGKPSDRVRHVYEIVERAQNAGVAALKAGASGEEVDAAARRVIEEAGFGPYFTHRLGHGLGMDGHEEPYLVKGNRTPLVAGNVETVEPGIYLPGEFGIRIEDDFAVTADGSVRLSPPSRGLEILV
jgi:Xaa-Pro dipeptidase